MQYFLKDPMSLGVEYPIIGANSVVFSVADPVYINSDGFIALATAGSLVFGYSIDAITMSATNQTVAKVCPKIAPALGHIMSYPNNGAHDFVQTDIGAYADFQTATTGAFDLNNTTAANAQMLILGFDPAGEADNDQGVVRVAEYQGFAYAQV